MDFGLLITLPPFVPLSQSPPRALSSTVFGVRGRKWFYKNSYRIFQDLALTPPSPGPASGSNSIQGLLEIMDTHQPRVLR
jgi:hypothetical protein